MTSLVIVCYVMKPGASSFFICENTENRGSGVICKNKCSSHLIATINNVTANFPRLMNNLRYRHPIGAPGICHCENQEGSERAIAAAALCDGSKWRQSI